MDFRKSFTFVEVMLAVAILAIGIAGVLRGYTVSVNILGISQDNIDAVYLLKSKMAEIEQMVIEGSASQLQSGNGQFQDRYANFEWIQQVSAPPACDPQVSLADMEQLRKVSISVFNSQRKVKREVSLVSYVLDYKEEEEEE